MKRNMSELKIERKWAIIDYHEKNRNIKQTDLIKHFNQLYKVIIPPNSISGIQIVASRKKKEKKITLMC